MLSFLAKHSSVFLILAGVAGFLFPSLSAAIFPYLPQVLFFLMLLTLLGMNQNQLVKTLFKANVWRYTFVHSVLLTIISCTIAKLIGGSDSFMLAIAGVTATGSLFATPAIARSIGLDTLEAMAMTIASTLAMPVILFINLLIFQDNDFQLDLVSYAQRLLIFLAGPMLFSAIVYRFVPNPLLLRVHEKLSQVTIILVFSFPFGLVGPFRGVFDQSLSSGLFYSAVGVALCVLFFAVGYFLFRKQGDTNAAILAATASVNRNVLLTYTVAGSYLGPEFIILMGAIQIPTSALPLFIRWLKPRLEKRKQQESEIASSH
ncbi:hypothetical protein L4D09_26525 [Photobacterium makurazakiensis]|uniref:hypothetical protein n=1 Tax=Photobacterium makurazakiensis TaxID=2910234 RepID=UPI003D0B4306